MKNTSLNSILSNIDLPDKIKIRQFKEDDFELVREIYKNEGWLTFTRRSEDAKMAWLNSQITLVAEKKDSIIGFLRALTDGLITTYIAEILVDKKHRGEGIGKALIDTCHYLYPHTRIDLLSTESANDFYRYNEFREFTGFRKRVTKQHTN